MSRQSFDFSALSLTEVEACEQALSEAEAALADIPAWRRALMQDDIAELEVLRQAVDARRTAIFAGLQSVAESALPWRPAHTRLS